MSRSLLIVPDLLLAYILLFCLSRRLAMWFFGTFCMNIHPLHSFLIFGKSSVTLPYVLRYTPYSIHSLSLIIISLYRCRMVDKHRFSGLL